jgi:hypothetical protein
MNEKLTSGAYPGYLASLIPAEPEFQPRASQHLGKSAAFGCSFTFGIGVEEGQDWPSILGLYNLGRPGSSNDRLVRMAVDYVFKYRPDNIHVLWAYPERREWLDQDNVLKKFNPVSKHNQNTYWHKSHTLLSNAHADAYNFDRNRLLLHTVCQLNNVRVLELRVENMRIRDFGLGSDGSHPGPDWHVHVADVFRQISQL